MTSGRGMSDPDAYRAAERAAFDRAVGAYERVVAPVTARVAEALADLTGVGPDRDVLDAGCGPGVVAAVSAGRRARVAGADVSPEMVTRARRRVPQGEFVVSPVETLPFADASFDIALANFLVSHLPEPDAAMLELARVTRPGGRVGVTSWDVPERSLLVGSPLLAMARAGFPPPDDDRGRFRFADEGELVGLLDRAGLVSITVTTLGFTHAFPSADVIWAGLHRGSARTAALIDRLKPTEAATVRSAFDDVLAPHRAADGSIVLPISVKLAVATRP
jgi:SAM-dependent methyltransferase